MIEEPFMETYKDHQIIIVRVKININLKSLTIEEMIGKRRRAQIVMIENLMKEVRFDLKLLQIQFSDEQIVSALLPMESMKNEAKECDAEWFNEDENFRRHVNHALELKRQALFLLYRQWLEAEPKVST